jgi:hypothetical protein
MGLVGHGSNQDLGQKMSRLADMAATSESTPQVGGRAQRRRRRPWGEMRRAIETVLGSAGEMRARDVHLAVQQVLGEAVTPSSVKNCLAANSRGTAAPFVRVGAGATDSSDGHAARQKVASDFSGPCAETA